MKFTRKGTFSSTLLTRVLAWRWQELFLLTFKVYSRLILWSDATLKTSCHFFQALISVKAPVYPGSLTPHACTLISFLAKLELLPPHRSEVAVYLHVCPDSWNICSD